MNKENNLRLIRSKKFNWEKATALGTVAMFIVFTIMSIWQNMQTRDSLAKTDTSNQLARQNYIDENRPYVFPGTPTAKRSIYFKKERLAHVPIINYGHTPAYIVFMGISYQKWKPLPDVRYENYPKNSDTIVLAPNSTYVLNLLPTEKYWSEKDTACREFIVGKILYGDNWNTRLHFTAFAYKLISRTDSSFMLVYQSGDANEQTQTNK
jgi:hypothetical protein